jgi:hypothetical protein
VSELHLLMTGTVTMVIEFLLLVVLTPRALVVWSASSRIVVCWCCMCRMWLTKTTGSRTSA